jgi:hypothetical protein
MYWIQYFRERSCSSILKILGLVLLIVLGVIVDRLSGAMISFTVITISKKSSIVQTLYSKESQSFERQFIKGIEPDCTAIWPV